MKNKIKVIFIIFFLLLINSLSWPADSLKNNSYTYWLRGGLGVSFAKFSGSDGGLGYNIEVCFKYNSILFSIDYQAAEEFKLFVNPNESVESFNFLLGTNYDFEMRGLIFPFPLLLILKDDFNYSVIASAGFGMMSYTKRKSLIHSEFLNSEYSSEIEKAIGIPINIEFYNKINSFIGMGIGMFANLNKVKPFYSIYGTIYLGKLK